MKITTKYALKIKSPDKDHHTISRSVSREREFVNVFEQHHYALINHANSEGL